MPYLIVFVSAVVVALLATPLAQRLSVHLELVARPGGRRRHEGMIPKLGGLPVFLAFLVGAGLAWWLLPPAPPDANPDDARLLRGVLWGSLLMFAGGLADDRLELPPSLLFFIQFLAVAVAIGHQVFIQQFTLPVVGPVELEWRSDAVEALVMFLLTSLWIVGMANTVNFLDGLDGLAVGVGTIAALLFAWHGHRLGQTTIAAFPLALAGALLGFLPFNFAPARIFLGSAGAYFLGYGLATMAILSPAKIATALLVLAVPIMDVAWQIFDRLRKGKSPFRGDRGHLHFRLSDFGLPTRTIVIGYYFVASVFGLVAIFAASPLTKLMMLIVLSLMVLAGMAWLSYRARGRANRDEPSERAS